MRDLPHRPTAVLASAAALVLSLTACGSDTPSAASPVPAAVTIGFPPGDGVPTRTEAEVCKFGSSATIEIRTRAGNGTVTFDTTTVNDGACLSIRTSLSSPFPDSLFLTEIGLPAGLQLDSIVTLQGITPNQSTPLTVTRTVRAGGTAMMLTGLEWGAVIMFYNSVTPPPPPPPGGGEGCTPGYWKQSKHFDSWPAAYTPDMLFSSVFEEAFPGQTLLPVASNGGGGLDALGRHTVAALLNAGSTGVSYDFTTADVIAKFNAVFPGTKNAYTGLKDTFEGFNTQGCPLN